MPKPSFHSLPIDVRLKIYEMARAPQPAVSTSREISSFTPMMDKFHLFALPAEVRNQIYELVLYHEHSDGIIAPTRDRSVASRWQFAVHDSLTMIARQRFRVGRKDQAFVKKWNVHASVFAQPWDNHEERKFHLYCSANFRFDHLCTLGCLVQPPLTRVSSRIREEALAAFYSANIFHIELDNFVLADSHGWFGQRRSPVDWWRAIGDTNLRSIREMNVCGSVYNITGSPDEEYGVMIKYRKNALRAASIEEEKGTPISKRFLVGGRVNAPQDGKLDAAIRDRFRRKRARGDMLFRTTKQENRAARRVQSYLDIMSADGLHVRVLEGIVAEIEPNEFFYLRDESALEGPTGTGGILLPVLPEYDD